MYVHRSFLSKYCTVFNVLKNHLSDCPSRKMTLSKKVLCPQWVYCLWMLSCQRYLDCGLTSSTEHHVNISTWMKWNCTIKWLFTTQLYHRVRNYQSPPMRESYIDLTCPVYKWLFVVYRTRWQMLTSCWRRRRSWPRQESVTQRRFIVRHADWKNVCTPSWPVCSTGARS